MYSTDFQDYLAEVTGMMNRLPRGLRRMRRRLARQRVKQWNVIRGHDDAQKHLINRLESGRTHLLDGRRDLLAKPADRGTAEYLRSARRNRRYWA